MDVDPTHHHVILENEHVRVFEVLAAPGATSPMHAHLPSVMVSVGKARANMTRPDGTSYIFDVNPGVDWLDKAEHSWKLLSGQLHVIGVEVKAAARGETPAALKRSLIDAVSVDPTQHHVILENDHVRVVEVLAAPGAMSPMHAHPPTVLISLNKARFRVTEPHGASFIFDLNPAQVLWVDDLKHSWQLLAGQAHVIAVEMKAAR